jgi:hypothetical protein
MVEAHVSDNEENKDDATFIQKPAILDQLKAASLITNSTSNFRDSKTRVHA